MKLITQILILLISTFSFSQETMSDLLKKHNTRSVPYISVQELAMPKTEAIIFDAREPKEYDTSHIKDAICVGYDYFNIETGGKTGNSALHNQAHFSLPFHQLSSLQL